MRFCTLYLQCWQCWQGYRQHSSPRSYPVLTMLARVPAAFITTFLSCTYNVGKGTGSIHHHVLILYLQSWQGYRQHSSPRSYPVLTMLARAPVAFITTFLSCTYNVGKGTGSIHHHNLILYLQCWQGYRQHSSPRSYPRS